MIALAHDLGLNTVAEGVEDKETLEILKLLRCDIAQGYYFGQPAPREEMERMLPSRQYPDIIDNNTGLPLPLPRG